MKTRAIAFADCSEAEALDETGEFIEERWVGPHYGVATEYVEALMRIDQPCGRPRFPRQPEEEERSMERHLEWLGAL